MVDRYYRRWRPRGWNRRITAEAMDIMGIMDMVYDEMRAEMDDGLATYNDREIQNLGHATRKLAEWIRDSGFGEDVLLDVAKRLRAIARKVSADSAWADSLGEIADRLKVLHKSIKGKSLDMVLEGIR